MEQVETTDFAKLFVPIEAPDIECYFVAVAFSRSRLSSLAPACRNSHPKRRKFRLFRIIIAVQLCRKTAGLSELNGLEKSEGRLKTNGSKGWEVSLDPKDSSSHVEMSSKLDTSFYGALGMMIAARSVTWPQLPRIEIPSFSWQHTCSSLQGIMVAVFQGS
eukprot:2116977-Amphidinium_carterae.1